MDMMVQNAQRVDHYRVNPTDYAALLREIPPSAMMPEPGGALHFYGVRIVPDVLIERGTIAPIFTQERLTLRMAVSEDVPRDTLVVASGKEVRAVKISPEPAPTSAFWQRLRRCT